MKKVGIIMGSDSDLPIIKKATDQLKALDIPFEAHVYSAHRTPAEARSFAMNARRNGFGVLIAAAGMAAHLAGAIAANTTLPVIGIPCKSAALDGMDALLATVMMPRGRADPGCGGRRSGREAGRQARRRCPLRAGKRRGGHEKKKKNLPKRSLKQWKN